MSFQGFLTFIPLLKNSTGWSVRYDDRKEGNSEILHIPIEIAEWTDEILKHGFTEFNDDSDDFEFDEPDDSPKWPYPEDEFIKPETDEEMVGIRDPRIRGTRII